MIRVVKTTAIRRFSKFRIVQRPNTKSVNLDHKLDS